MMKRMILTAAAVAIGAASDAPPLCGAKGSGGADGISPAVMAYQVACIDFPSLARLGLPVPGDVKPQTQVLISASAGVAVRVQVGDTVKFSDLRPHNGALGAMVSFDGMAHTELKIDVLEKR